MFVKQWLFRSFLKEKCLISLYGIDLYECFAKTFSLRTYLAKIRDVIYNSAGKIKVCTNSVINYEKEKIDIVYSCSSINIKTIVLIYNFSCYPF